MAMSSSVLGSNEQNTEGEGGPRRNDSSNMMIIAQTCTPAIMVTFQEASVTRTCIINV